MPAQPAWFHRIEEILCELHSTGNEYLDRQAVEKLFRVRQRRARQLMAGLPQLQIGNAIAVSRQALIDRVEATARGEAFQYETARRARIAEHLESIRRQAAAHSVRIPITPDARNRTVRDLSPGIELRPNEVRIQFTGAEDLAAKLFELSQSMANDWLAFTRSVEEYGVQASIPSAAAPEQ